MRLVIMVLIAGLPIFGEAAVSRTKKDAKPAAKKQSTLPQKARVPAKPVEKPEKPAVEAESSILPGWVRSLFSLRTPARTNPVIPKPVAPRAVPAKPVVASTAYASLGLQPTSFTPYDRYLENVWPVLKRLDEGEAPMLRALRLMEKGRSFSYRFTDPYRPQSPETTAAKRSGDCKSKALWLCSALGDPSALWVVGKKTRSSSENHCWVYWRNEGRWYVLDCTENTVPIPTDQLSRDRYIPYYSFGKAGAFRHSATRIQLAVHIPTSKGDGLTR